MDKAEEVMKYSNPNKVSKLARKYLGKEYQIYFSTRKNKKYMVQDPNGKWIHFGELPYEDFTKHQDKERRSKFQKRNAKWKDADKWSPSFLSYWLLWS